ncbi:Leucine-rich receptor-like protein kinase family protein [Rhynchospora pubera]|uniref:non-specific serine/threonine protein kinase n=1 Tax=Rhynchospora pubera TaxID=906938 RepID=A0AAV8ERQ7_9POAL|nr:Leucine-rich receptor-like protein kinase family protein [Rhynchospora pubera]
MAPLSHTLLFLFCLLFLSPTSLSNPLPLSKKEQASILVSLKNSLATPSPLFQSWSLSNHTFLCSWPGVHCDPSDVHVVKLDISNANLTGSITELALLTSLKYLNVSNNQINCSLSSFNFSSLSQLEVFDAYNNNFFGTLPLGFVTIPNLRHLDLGGNYFSGEIPKEYGSFQSIKFLSLAGNDLSGRLPAEIGNLTTLEQLFLGYFNQFIGGIPAEMGKLVNLFHLDLSSCGLSGQIPPELGNLKKLNTLYLQTNQLTGEIPRQIGNLTRLRFLDLSNNGLGGEIPAELSQLQELELLQMFMNRLHGQIPGFVAELPNLSVLKLWQNNFTGSIPDRLGVNGGLRELDLSTNKLTGLIPKYLCYGRKLEILILLNNFLFGPLPDDLGRCETLSRVRIGQNYLTGSIPNGFLYLPELTLVELQNNYFNGSLEDNFVKKPAKLGQLNLSNNRLFGSLPITIGNFSALQILLINGNQFTGEIPYQLGFLKHVLKIDMSQNNFTGSIPAEIGNCASLTYLDVSQNSLTGPIPAQIAQIKILNYLNVSWNNLNGGIPKEIGFVKSLTSADFSHNNLSGWIPQVGQFVYLNSSSFVSNPQLCGPGISPCNLTNPFQSQSDQVGVGAKPSMWPGKVKLFFAIGLLFCSIVFAVTAVLKTRSMMLKRQSNVWQLTAFQKLDFGCNDIVECLKENYVIGRGGAGVVYRGTLPNGELVAVKRLLAIGKGSAHDNGLSAEIQTLGKIRHRNIVRLLAFCSNKETNLLVYEYMMNGSLGEVLHGKRGGYLNWQMRLRIAIEAAKGLCYLHHDCSPPILHRDVKSNNILLDSDFEAHVADFGLAKYLRDIGASECMSAIAGSYGYIAPEYAYTLKVDEKSDVYSFGVVLLELVTGRKPVGDFGEEGLDLVQWARLSTNCSKEGVVKIMDPRLVNAPREEVMQVFFVSMLCVQEQSIERPTMWEVVQMLEQVKQQSLPCGSQMN